MTIVVNGKERGIAEATTVSAMLDEMEIHPAAVVVELNRQALLRNEYDQTRLQPGDQVELFRVVAGG